MSEDYELYHYGVLGMKWGVRKDRTVFVSGSSKTQSKDSKYYRKDLPNQVKTQLDTEMNNKSKIIVGDAPGVDRQVQNYLHKKNYKNVEVYSPGDTPRYIANKNWKNKFVQVKGAEVGSKEWLAGKDKAMSDAADSGIAVTLDDGSSATKRNIRRLVDSSKNVYIYELSGNGKNSDTEIGNTVQSGKKYVERNGF